jgi:hypothetical protein
MTRVNNGVAYNQGSRVESPYAAAGHLLEFELGFGGAIKEITTTRLVTVTRIFNCLDTTVFEGSEEDMLPLLAVAYAWVGLDHEGAVDTAIEILQASVGLRAFYVTNALPLMVGQTKLQMIANAMAPFQPPDDLRPELRKLPIEDLFAIYELLEKGANYDDLRPLISA